MSERDKHRLKAILKANRPDGVGWRQWQQSVDDCVDINGCDWLEWLMIEHGNLAADAVEKALLANQPTETVAAAAKPTKPKKYVTTKGI